MGCQGDTTTVALEHRDLSAFGAGAATAPLYVGGMDRGRIQGALRSGAWTTAIVTLKVTNVDPLLNRWVDHPDGVTRTSAGMSGVVDFRGILWARLEVTTGEGADSNLDVAITAWKARD